MEGGSSTPVLVELRASSGAKEELQSVQQGLVDTESHQLKLMAKVQGSLWDRRREQAATRSYLTGSSSTMGLQLVKVMKVESRLWDRLRERAAARLH